MATVGKEAVGRIVETGDRSCVFFYRRDSPLQLSTDAVSGIGVVTRSGLPSLAIWTGKNDEYWKDILADIRPEELRFIAKKLTDHADEIENNDIGRQLAEQYEGLSEKAKKLFKHQTGLR